MTYKIPPQTKKTVAAGVLFGMGFLCGFLSGYNYAGKNIVYESPPILLNEENISSRDIQSNPETSAGTEIFEDAPAFPEVGDIGLSLREHWMDSDEHGLYIAGQVKNDGPNSFDAVRVAFDLCDDEGGIYSAVTARNDERIEPGEAWDFTAYLPYSDMDKFKSYKLQSIMGVKR
ncbi:MAG: FxLYD domain-containing protein [Synergistaceae bacterium]|jgi:hypothetical protein|nr:FxLYD domain-containing protein [Synergistaceae bacterium]